MNNIQQTSIEAYESICYELNKRQKHIYQALLRLGIANNTRLAIECGMLISSVTPRIFELRAMGLVEFSHIRPCPITKRNTIWWKIAQNSIKIIKESSIGNEGVTVAKKFHRK